MEFDAAIEAAPAGTGGAFVRLPAEAADVFATRARFPVTVTFDGVAYRGSTMPMGDGTFCVGVTKAIRTQLGAGIGDTVHVVLDRDEGERTVDIPEELAAALAADPDAGVAFAQLSFSHRREYAAWVGEAKKPETRERRAGDAVARITSRP
jgi:hypothetical protein